MKQAYFTSKTIKMQTKQFLDQLDRKKIFEINKGKIALLGLDLQEHFLNPNSHAFIPSAPPILPNVTAMSKAFHGSSRPVIYTQHLNTPENAGRMGDWWRDLITADHPLAGLSPELDLGSAQVIQKTQYDAFYQTDLEERLREHRIEEVVICGVVTHLCCESTARSAFVRGFRVWFTIDATASYQADFHLGSLRNLNHGFAVPVLTDEVLAAL